MPMKVWAKPEPGMVTIGELNDVAMPLDSIVLPVPGGAEEEQAALGLAAGLRELLARLPELDHAATSSLGSAWPRTSSSLTPQSASPGS